MAAGLTGTDEYLDGFRWGETQEREGSNEEVAAAVVSELETAYLQLDWQRRSSPHSRPEQSGTHVPLQVPVSQSQEAGASHLPQE